VVLDNLKRKEKYARLVSDRQSWMPVSKVSALNLLLHLLKGERAAKVGVENSSQQGFTRQFLAASL
jgi:hypothetical protein